MQLKIINLEELQNFRELYKSNEPQYCEELLTLNYFINLSKNETFNNNFKALTLSDSLAQQLGLYLIVDRYQLFLGCLGTSFELLEQALHLLDWSKVLHCSSMPARYVKTVKKVIREKHFELNLQIVTNLYHISAKQALQFDVSVPKGFELRSLTGKDADLVDKEWPYKEEGSLYFMQRQIQTNPSMGLFDVHSQKLIAWCIRTQDGLLAALKVCEQYKRCGFGSLVVKGLSKQIAVQGEDIAAEVIAENIASSTMFQKLGFTVIDECCWLSIKSDSSNFTWPKGQ